MSIEDIYKVFRKHPNIKTDSREVEEGDLFIAIRGDNHDGNRFVSKALDQGGSYAIIDNKEYYQGERTIVVEDTLKTLQDLARHHRKALLDIPLLAITGTNGKTTTKELAHSILSQKYRCIATEGNYNNHIGLPLSLLRIQEDTEVAIMEMGANHIGEIAFLASIALPDYGLITNIGRAHLEGFGGFENIIKAKTELFRYLDQKDHFPIINLDDENLRDYSKTHKNEFISYITNSLDSYETAAVEYKGKTIISNLIGHYNSQNIMAAIKIGEVFGVSIEESDKAISSYYPSNNRSQIKETEENTIILDAYNANPSSMRVAIEEFLKSNRENKIICLGSMKELGEESIQEHKKIIEIVEKHDYSWLYLVGEEFGDIYNKIERTRWFETSKQLRDYLEANPIKGGNILIKGSRSTEMEVIEDVL